MDAGYTADLAPPIFSVAARTVSLVARHSFVTVLSQTTPAGMSRRIRQLVSRHAVACVLGNRQKTGTIFCGSGVPFDPRLPARSRRRRLIRRPLDAPMKFLRLASRRGGLAQRTGRASQNNFSFRQIAYQELRTEVGKYFAQVSSWTVSKFRAMQSILAAFKLSVVKHCTVRCAAVRHIMKI